MIWKDDLFFVILCCIKKYNMKKLVDIIIKVLDILIWILFGMIMSYIVCGLVFSSVLVVLFPFTWYFLSFKSALFIFLIGIVIFYIFLFLGRFIYKKLYKQIKSL